MYTHRKQIFATGTPLGQAEKTLIMLHGRGANAGGISMLAHELKLGNAAVLALKATRSSWYPYSFLAPLEDNQPALDSALAVIREVVDDVLRAGIGLENVYFLGFSQGACLALEYIARNPAHYGGAIAFTGGLIGEQPDFDRYKGDLGGTRILVTTGDPDTHVPLVRVEESVATLRGMNANVTLQVFPGRMHTILQEEIDLANDVVFNERL